MFLNTVAAEEEDGREPVFVSVFVKVSSLPLIFIFFFFFCLFSNLGMQDVVFITMRSYISFHC